MKGERARRHGTLGVGSPVYGLLFGRRGEVQEQRLLARIRLRARDLAVQPRRLFLVEPAVEIGAQTVLSGAWGGGRSGQ